MTDEVWTWTHETEIASEHAAGSRVVEAVLEQLQIYQWCEQDCFAIQLCLEEALVNAIRHGNGLDTSKCVRVTCKLSSRRFYIKITDEGEGFNPEAVPDPTEDEYLDRDCGRGVHLMRNFMTEVRYNAAGNSVVMEKIRKLA